MKTNTAMRTARKPKYELVPVTKAARIIGCTTETLRKMRIAGTLYCEIRYNGRWGIPDFEVERLRLGRARA